MLYPDSESIQAARARYYEMNGLPTDGGSQDKWARYKLGNLELIAFPNFQHRIEALSRHDIHHIINNIDTSPLGEGLIGAWEMGAGCGPYWISWCMESQAMVSGLFIAPKKVFELFLNGRNSKSLYHRSIGDEVAAMTVGEMRKKLLPPASSKISATLADSVLFVAASILGIAMLAVFIPIFIVFGILGKTVLRGA